MSSLAPQDKQIGRFENGQFISSEEDEINYEKRIDSLIKQYFDLDKEKPRYFLHNQVLLIQELNGVLSQYKPT